MKYFKVLWTPNQYGWVCTDSKGVDICLDCAMPVELDWTELPERREPGLVCALCSSLGHGHCGDYELGCCKECADESTGGKL